ncbi:predicted protein [Sclerotinia sclerotiorum 1980 UF-70]|uniref:Uncharacterized protein n=1 Tax=Sclerotinia sclerotiorum (strain ATCC 18683 / 1980 / Ss-1) TaxID=665079 RepID=A7E7Y5_SCLS1|nr:predicted protein [Sclerotinia sclerotiorum 1980 UF-70]EDN96487.1 predicted protein [Sclerotinia sclerotiorum 1980 UF-70]
MHRGNFQLCGVYIQVLWSREKSQRENDKLEMPSYVQFIHASTDRSIEIEGIVTATQFKKGWNWAARLLRLVRALTHRNDRY